jgi:hypothetical protein
MRHTRHQLLEAIEDLRKRHRIRRPFIKAMTLKEKVAYFGEHYTTEGKTPSDAILNAAYEELKANGNSFVNIRLTRKESEDGLDKVFRGPSNRLRDKRS